MSKIEILENSTFITCDVRSSSRCEFNYMFGSLATNIFLYNPGQKGKYLVKILVDHGYYKVVDINNGVVPAEIFCETDKYQGDLCFLYFK